jgi:cyanophycinase
MRAHLPEDDPKAAYVGAANGDDPAFFDIFAGAMDAVGVTDRRMIPGEPGDEDLEYLEAADLVLLAGGDVGRGWRAITGNGVREVLLRRAGEGLVLAGVSAGAVHLGWLGAVAPDPTEDDLEEMLQLVPAVVGAHEEADRWRPLRRTLRLAALPVRGMGIPSGGALVYHPDETFEPVRHPVVEVVREGGAFKPSLLLPP